MDRSTSSSRCRGEMTKIMEQKLKKIPASAFLCAAVGALGVSFMLKCMGRTHNALFVGQLAAPLLIVGAFKKMKQEMEDEKAPSPWEVE